jgi:hypothetical protein
MLYKLFEDDDFHQVSSARGLVNIFGTVRAIFLLFEWKGLQQRHHYYGGRNLISEP